MIEVRLPESKPRRLPFYLAMEEWVAANLPADDYIFSWRVAPTVICGRNQDMPLEVNLPYCRANGIDVVRRRSGGGCVYADMNNYMFSFIAPGADVDANFARYTALTADLLRSLGYAAEVSGRNDLLVDGHKIAGNAFYRLADRSIVHGTMLFDIDTERMANAITPSRAKLESKAVQSAPARITCLKWLGTAMSVDDFGAYALRFLAKGAALKLSPGQVAEIEAIEQRYYEPDFLYGRPHVADGNIRRHRRIDGCGEFCVDISTDREDRITKLMLYGDFFALGDINRDIERQLTGVRYHRETLAEAIARIDTPSLIRGLSQEALLDILK